MRHGGLETADPSVSASSVSAWWGHLSSSFPSLPVSICPAKPGAAVHMKCSEILIVVATAHPRWPICAAKAEEEQTQPWAGRQTGPNTASLCALWEVTHPPGALLCLYRFVL